MPQQEKKDISGKAAFEAPPKIKKEFAALSRKGTSNRGKVSLVIKLALLRTNFISKIQ